MILFLYGEDLFRSSQKLKELKNKFLSTDKFGAGLSVFEYGEKNFRQKFLDVVNAPSLLTSKRLIVVKQIIELGSEDEREEMIKYLLKNEKQIQADQDLVLVFWENHQPKKNGKLFKLLVGISKSQNFEKISGAKLDNWISQRIKELEVQSGISQTALEELILHTGGEIYILDKEIQKLVAYAGQRIIQVEDVEILVRDSAEVNIFDTIDALGNNNKKRALELVQKHVQDGEDPFYVFSMFVYQFRNILRVADLQHKLRGNDFAIAKEAGLHPFVVKKSLNQIRNFPSERLRSIYEKLGDIDRKIKTGQMDVRLALEKFIVEL